MTNPNDLIRRGDALARFSERGLAFVRSGLEAIPAVQPTVSPELLATTNDVAALVEALREISIRPCNMTWGEDAEVREAMRDMQMVAEAALAALIEVRKTE